MYLHSHIIKIYVCSRGSLSDTFWKHRLSSLEATLKFNVFKSSYDAVLWITSTWFYYELPFPNYPCCASC